MSSWAPSATPCRAVSTAGCRCCVTNHWRACRASTGWRGPGWRTQTAASTCPCFKVTCAPTSPAGRSRCRSFGRCTPRCAWCCWRICAAWLNALRPETRRVTPPMPGPTQRWSALARAAALPLARPTAPRSSPTRPYWRCWSSAASVTFSCSRCGSGSTSRGWKTHRSTRWATGWTPASLTRVPC